MSAPGADRMPGAAKPQVAARGAPRHSAGDAVWREMHLDWLERRWEAECSSS
ncbi:MAG: hypothetical protein AAF646_06790 [Pseudomonadota bacterium]